MKQIMIDDIGTWYYITEDGRCYNSITGNWLRGQENCRSGYLSYHIKLPDGRKRRCAAHRLVALAYIPQTDDKRTQVNHKDGDKLNNHVDNLEWVTPQENQRHALSMELRKHRHVYCFAPDKRLVAEYRTITEAARATGVSVSTIQQETSKDVKALSGGFFWSYSPTLEKTVTYGNLGRAKVVYQYTRKGRYITSYPSTGIAAKAVGGNSSHIGECCRGKIGTYKGYVWRYAEDIVSPSGESQSAALGGVAED